VKRLRIESRPAVDDFVTPVRRLLA